MSTIPDPTATDASLHLLADHLVEALAADEIAPSVVHIDGPVGDAFDLGIRALDGHHPTEHLLGFTAPEHWHAIGIVTNGWAYDLATRTTPAGEAHAEGERTRGSHIRARRRVHVVSLLSRSGEHAHRTLIPADPVETARLSPEPPQGEQVDLLRRCLGLPTDPPPCDAAVYWSLQWLTAVADRRPRRWATAIGLHPAMRLLRTEDARHDDAEVVEVIAAFHRVCDWARLRSLAADGLVAVPELDSTQAGWLDDGAFARFVLNRAPSMSMARDGALDAIPFDLADRLFDLLDDLEIPETAWPDDTHRAAA